MSSQSTALWHTAAPAIRHTGAAVFVHCVDFDDENISVAGEDAGARIALDFDSLLQLVLVQAREMAASAAEKLETPPPGSMEIASFEEFMQHGSSSKASRRKSRSESKQYVSILLRRLHLLDCCSHVVMRPSSWMTRIV